MQTVGISPAVFCFALPVVLRFFWFHSMHLMNQDNLVEVIPLTGIKKTLTYKVPPDLQATVKVGSLVHIPLRNRSELGVIIKMDAVSDIDPGKIKAIRESLYDYPALDETLLKLGDWMHHYYASPYDSIFEAMLPAPIRKHGRVKTVTCLEIANPLDDNGYAALRKKTPKQADVYSFLKEQNEAVPQSFLLVRFEITSSVVKSLVKKGILRTVEKQVQRDVYMDETDSWQPVKIIHDDLTTEQKAAAANISQLLDEEKFHVHLLHGVTGSGKTEVYIAAAKKTLEAGGGVLFLVPEVTLTPQTVSRLRAHFKASGVEIMVWHSHLSDGERFDAWHALASGKARVVVGARSAVFAPIPNLRLIIVDEEHEPSYKQENDPRYHGRDVAVYRAWLTNCLCLLGSATPSLETLYNIERKKYSVSHLTKRIDHRTLPTIHVVNMCREKDGAISRELLSLMQNRLDKREQTILFINRRGYSRSILCPDCGYVASCPHCSVPLTYHRSDEKMLCHLCNYQASVPHTCPECNSAQIRRRGQGTQKVEAMVKAMLPSAKIARIDTDAMTKKNLFREILDDFRRGKIDILVGTQMIAKGLDFPNVTLVGLMDADISLHVPDFRAHERTFQLIVQVAGRSGRGDVTGEVVIQTHTPEATPIQFARHSDFHGFFEDELNKRREFNYPPFRHLIRQLFTGRNEDKVKYYAEKWADHIESILGNKVEIRGPVPAPINKIKDEYRYQLWFFTETVASVVARIQAERSRFFTDNAISESIDVDPTNLT